MTIANLADYDACPYCGGMALKGTTCPRGITCPVGSCKAPPGSPCRRPSGHRASALHTDRIKLAEHIDHRNGITYPTSGALIQ